MIEQLKAAYTTNNRVKIAAFAGLLLCAVIFAVLSGGFPPWAWRFLFFTVLPSLPRLLALQGGVVFLPLLGLLLLSLSLLIVWVVIVTLMIKMGIHLWQVYHSRQNFNMDLREAEQMAEQNLAADELDRWFEEDKSPANRQRTPLPISGATNSVYSTQAKKPQMREYIAAARAAGGSVYPETPTPISNPTLLAPSPVPVARERPGLWTQQGSRQNGERNAEQTRIYNTTKTTNTVSLPSYNNTPPANPTRKQLRIVPPPPVEEISAMDTEHSIDSAFSALIKRGQREQEKQPDPTGNIRVAAGEAGAARAGEASRSAGNIRMVAGEAGAARAGEAARSAGNVRMVAGKTGAARAGETARAASINRMAWAVRATCIVGAARTTWATRVAGAVKAVGSIRHLALPDSPCEGRSR